jgi:hypothetical protein
MARTSRPARNRTPHAKPVPHWPISFDDDVSALLKTPPPPKGEKAEKPTRTRKRKAGAKK